MESKPVCIHERKGEGGSKSEKGSAGARVQEEERKGGRGTEGVRKSQDGRNGKASMGQRKVGEEGDRANQEYRDSGNKGGTVKGRRNEGQMHIGFTRVGNK